MTDVMKTRVRVVTPPSEYPVTVDEVKAHLGITDSSQDTYLTNLIAVGAEYAQNFLGRKFLTHDMEMYLDTFSPGDVWWDGVVEAPRASMFGAVRMFEFPWLPLQSVEQVSSFDWDDAETVLDASLYRIDSIDPNLWGRFALKETAVWPAQNFRNQNSIRALYSVGYADTQAEFKALQPQVWQGILAVVAWMFENRGDCSNDSCITQSSAMCIFGPMRVRKI